MKALGYVTTTKRLHLLLVVGVALQLALSLVMKHPKVGESREAWQLIMFEAHEFVGLALLALVIFHLIHTLRDAGDESAWHILFPWLKSAGRTQLFTELKMVPGWLKNGPPPQDVGIALPGAVHGAGLLLLLAMGLTGACIFLGLGEDGSRTDGIHDVMEFHGEVLGTLIWIFVIAHGVMGLWHERLGHKSKSRISPF
ncbi:MAG: cytochrome b/b6 domain-containing protein [Mariprofundales bacterium]|nr:cytochrome b/b6 domain-containing protein [Mariprofundales bacterium]